MSLRFKWFSIMVFAGLTVSVLIGGCSESAFLALPDPGNIPQTQSTTTIPIVIGLGPGNSQPNASSTAPAGVTGQNPILRTLTLINNLANNTIGGCTKPGTIPDLANNTLAQAQSALLLGGFAPGIIRWAYSATVPGGIVISQDPGAGASASPGTAVNLLLSLGPQLVTVPNTVGKPQTEAETAITEAGLTLGAVTQSHDSTVLSGNVISQDPGADTLALPGASVSLLVSQGPQPMAVPNVLGVTQADAQTALLAAGFTLGSVAQGSSATVPAGVVMSQNPVAGVMMAPGSTVDLVVSQGPQSVAVPNIVGRTQADAQATITGAGFSVGAVSQNWDATVPEGSVISQNPAAGVVMLPGTAVDFVVSRGPAPVAVPNVAGKTQADAQAEITGAGLTVGAVTQEYSETAPEGSVIGQEPAAGTLLPRGAAVSLVTAKKYLSLCEYYPFAVGNRWVTAGTNGNNGVSAEISEAFIINGCPCWKVTSIDHGANDKVTYSYVANANGWMYQYAVMDDLFLLPGIAPKAQKVAPQTVVPGESFTATFNGTTLNVTPVKGRLSDFVNDVSACPFGDVQDAVALKLGNFVLVVFARDLGPVYYNYITQSGFYSSITIVGGCGSTK